MDKQASLDDESKTSAEADRTREQTYRIIGAAMQVHTRLGFGFAEGVYHHAMAIELRHDGVPYKSEVPLPIVYRGEQLPVSYRADFVCFDEIIVELIATAALADRDRSQVMNYLKATGLARGLVLNFGAERLEYKRVLWASNLKTSVPSVEPMCEEEYR